jgi:hypothetical protein
MNNRHGLLWLVKTICLVWILGVSMNADAGFLGFGGDNWKEEVLLHDGSKIIVNRSQSYGGRHEIGQSPPIKEHTITFTLPGSHNVITWTSEYGEDLGRTNFNLLALHILNGTPYIVAEPNLMLSYNKWGRPNPPYVFFKYDGKAWQRITLEELPAEFKNINLVINTLAYGEQLDSQGLASAEAIKKLNSSLTQEEYKTIHRIPLDHWKPRPSGSNSGRMVRTKDGWVGMDWFETQSSIEACLKLCEKKGVSPQDCPCHTLFKGK